MTRDRIREIAIANKFTLRGQEGREEDLDEYVFEFAEAVMKEHAKELRDEIERLHDGIHHIHKEVNELKKTDWHKLGFR